MTNTLTSQRTLMPSISQGFSLKYSELRERARRQLEQDGWKANRVANFMVAFNGWLKCHDMDDHHIVGQEMQAAFDATSLAYINWLREKGISERTQRDRFDFLLLLRKLHRDLSCQDELPKAFGLAIIQLIERDPRSTAVIGSEAGIPKSTIESWVAERHTPSQRNAAQVRNLETVLNIPNGTLTSRLEKRPYSSKKSERSGLTRFGQRMRQIVVSGERVRIAPTDRLMAQWLDFLRYKTDPLLEGADAHALWRTKLPHQSGVLPAWNTMVDGLICPTAGVYWSLFSGYLGWLTRERPEGEGMPAHQADTLAWLVHTEHLIRHTNWRIGRAEKIINNGTLNFLRFAKSVLRPQTGYVWHTDQLAETLPEGILLAGRLLSDIDISNRREAWRLACESTHDALTKRIHTIIKNNRVKFSRDPQESIQAILAHDEPLRVILDMIRTMEIVVPPKRHGGIFYVWLRDLLLIKMMCTNPLRVSQYAAMTYRADNTGNLYCTPNGEWRLRFKSSDFKNERGAAKENYEVSVPRSIWPTIHQYLTESRPYLIGAVSSDFLFLPMQDNAGDEASEHTVDRRGMWHGKAISRRVQELSMRYLPEYPPFAGHSLRHIVATDYLKRVPGDYPTVARLLHDELSTVLNKYAHMDVDTGLRRLHDYVDSILIPLAPQQRS